MEKKLPGSCQPLGLFAPSAPEVPGPWAPSSCLGAKVWEAGAMQRVGVLMLLRWARWIYGVEVRRKEERRFVRGSGVVEKVVEVG